MLKQWETMDWMDRDVQIQRERKDFLLNATWGIGKCTTGATCTPTSKDSTNNGKNSIGVRILFAFERKSFVKLIRIEHVYVLQCILLYFEQTMSATSSVASSNLELMIKKSFFF
ncbi:hypothetical protein CEXT_386761 [Caerostris extrusa]|uniref:Uncharacterized protein n=1 Tax=Caerostris extrusa TaxID=172846 RepID=A0AAV4NPD7_CAEEX|nr:hypothetical protein CEXT_386761 [Caerostris extrusa]